ncbi:Hypothetical predicted protein [Mytilus galloprovincialis]|uniref:Reverse transcriptase domain-containing protein n=1 Tax=Mytilus galloprovincialis TaxID=29158 RepID=A0A8B6GP50_MYTGA|nr:Hypothetical predicted protein [Mytilus galloprovincialis]
MAVLHFFKFLVLPFGLSTACFIFTKLTRPLVKKWRSEGKQVIMYLDDGLGIEQDQEMCKIVSEQVKLDLVRSGFVPKAEKSLWEPTKRLVWLEAPQNIAHGMWVESERSNSSTWKELSAVKKVLLSLINIISGKKVKWFTDNQNVVSIVSKGSTKTILQNLALDIFSACLKYNVNIDIVWIPRTLNEKADFLSRIVDHDDWGISYYIFQLIESLWGPHEVDWFASDHNFKLLVFYSRFWNENSSGIDAFTVDWYGVNGLFVPPVFLIPRVINYMRQCNAAYESEINFLPPALHTNVDVLMDLLCESKADSTVKTYHAGFIRWKKWAVHNGISRCDILPAKSLHVALYLSSLVQNSHTASPVISAFYSIQWAHHMIGQTSPTENLVVKNVLEGAKRRLATRIEKKEPVTPEILSKMYSSSFKEYNVMSQRFICACLLAYSGFLRVSELLNIRRCDIIFELERERERERKKEKDRVRKIKRVRERDRVREKQKERDRKRKKEKERERKKKERKRERERKKKDKKKEREREKKKEEVREKEHFTFPK